MAGASTNRFGGNALLAGGILYTVALIIHPVVGTLADANAANPSMWAFVHWAYLIGDVLLIGGLLTLFRHLAASGGGSNEGWAAVAMAGGMVGFALDAASTGIHMFAFPPAIPANTPNLQTIFDGAGAANVGIGGAAVVAASLGLLALGTALKKEGWSAAVAYGAMLIGAIELLVNLLATFTGNSPVPAGMATLVVSALMPVWYAVVGMSFAKVVPK
jgi:hypothetical protein